MKSVPRVFSARDAFPAYLVRAVRSALFRAAALASAVHILLLSGISWNISPPSSGGIPEIHVELAPAALPSPPSTGKNAADASPDGDAPPEPGRNGHLPPDAAPPEHRREGTVPVAPARDHDPRVSIRSRLHPPTDSVPAEDTPSAKIVKKASGERAAAHEKKLRSPATAPAATQVGAGDAAARQATTDAAPHGISADESPRVLSGPAPRYPEQARRRGREGTVHVEADVDEQGIPTAVRVRRSSGCGILDGAAAGAVREWRFSPARIAGKAARQRVVVPIEFRLKEFRTSFLINKRELSPSGRRGQPANPG